MKKETEYESRLAELAASWFKLAAALDVYLQYEFTGAAPAAGPEGALEAMDALVARAIRRAGAAEEREDRWLNLTVDRQPGLLRLVCASSGICPAEPAALAELGAEAAVSQLPDIYQITADWRPAPTERAGDGPC